MSFNYRIFKDCDDVRTEWRLIPALRKWHSFIHSKKRIRLRKTSHFQFFNRRLNAHYKYNVLDLFVDPFGQCVDTLADILLELFFKWIKQNLKIKTFLGTSENAVLTQIWVAMIYYLLLAYIKFQTKFSRSLLELTRMIREVLFVRRNLIDMLSLDSISIRKFIKPPNPQLAMF